MRIESLSTVMFLCEQQANPCFTRSQALACWWVLTVLYAMKKGNKAQVPTYQCEKTKASANIPHFNSFVSGSRKEEGPVSATFLGLEKKEKKNFSNITWEEWGEGEEEERKSGPFRVKSRYKRTKVKRFIWSIILIISPLLLLPWHSGQETFFKLTRGDTCLRNTA